MWNGGIVLGKQKFGEFDPGLDHHLLRRDVEIGRQREGKIEIIKGLNPGEEYVAKGTLLLLDATSLTSE